MILAVELQHMRDINYMILHHATGTPEQFAQKLNLSRRQLYYMIEYLNDLGAPIKYSRKSETFYYADRFDFEIKIRINGTDY